MAADCLLTSGAVTEPMWEVIHFEVWDWDRIGGHDFMGQVEVGCGELIDKAALDDAESNMLLELEPRYEAKFKDLISGSIRIGISNVTELGSAHAAMGRSDSIAQVMHAD